MTRNKIQTIIISLLTTFTMVSTTGKNVNAQATASGAVVEYNSVTGFIQSVSGEISLPTGAFGLNNPLSITSVPAVNVGLNPNDPLNPIIPFLIINPGGIDFNTITPSLRQGVADSILNALSLSELVSVLRANPDFLKNPSTQQAIATGQTTLIFPDGSTQSASGEISLPVGLYYEGASSPQINGFDIDPNCGLGSGCLVISTVLEQTLESGGGGSFNTPRLKQLIIDPGNPNIAPYYDANSAAAFRLTGLTNLSDIVSVIRATAGTSGPFSTQTQARAMGMVSITTPNGTSQSISGEITLPAGLYFDGQKFDAGGGLVAINNYCGGSACLAVLPDIQWQDQFDANSAFINQLTINPGFVQPGDPNNLPPGSVFGPDSFDINGAAALKLYKYADDFGSSGIGLANVVSVIRAGARGSRLSPDNRPIARASGSATLSVPNGATQSVTGEISLPPSLFFTGVDFNHIQDSDTATNCSNGSACFLLTPVFDLDPLNPNIVTIKELTIDPGKPNDPAVIRGWDFDAAAGNALNQATTLEAQVSIIRAGAGAGLE